MVKLGLCHTHESIFEAEVVGLEDTKLEKNFHRTSFIIVWNIILVQMVWFASIEHLSTQERIFAALVDVI